MKRKEKLISIISAVFITFSSISSYYTVAASDLSGEIYMNEVFSQNIYELYNIEYKESYKTWQEFLDLESQTDDYIGTPYNTSMYAASPNCDPWQGYTGSNCTGFVWHIISNGLADAINNAEEIESAVEATIETTCKWVPNSVGFNNMGFAKGSWSDGGWWTFVNDKNLHYYEFTGENAKQDMLSSGLLNKGDIIWCVDPSSGYEGLSGLAVGSPNHHVGIYMGDGTSDLWWHSGVGAGSSNCISTITSEAEPCTYVVIPWSDDADDVNMKNVENAAVILDNYTKNTICMMIAKNMMKAADKDKDGNISIKDAIKILNYYAVSSNSLPSDWETLIEDKNKNNTSENDSNDSEKNTDNDTLSSIYY